MKPASRARQSGLSLIELLVAMVIALVVTLAVTSMVIVGDAHKRATTSTNDMDQTGAYAAYALDRALRSAGAGFTQSWDKGVFGCRLNAAAMLPRSSAFPAPFKNSFLSGATTLRVAPLLIGKNQSDAGSDVLVVMGGNGMAGGVPRAVTDAGISCWSARAARPTAWSSR
jgi:type IV pilus assembly protein PilW